MHVGGMRGYSACERGEGYSTCERGEGVQCM